MSYCRFSEDSDVYMYPDVMGGIVCCGCIILEGSLTFFTPDQALLHLIKHLRVSNRVPDRAFIRLIQEIKDDAKEE